jgi:CRP/FNR family transcriptional regulator, cyclic AMP receptor protein
MLAPPASRHSLLNLDPELGRLLEPERFAQARAELAVRVIALGRHWDPTPLERANDAHAGLLVLRGVVGRELESAGAVAGTELLGPGDLLRASPEDDVLDLSVRWRVLAPVTAAVLDRRAAQQLCRWPEIVCALLGRVSERAHRLAVTQAIAQLTGVERRLETLLWHLAGRFGRVTADGVVLPLTLSHRMLGEIIGARRPTVSSALGVLAREGRVQRRADGGWLLLGEPPALGQRAAAALARPA